MVVVVVVADPVVVISDPAFVKTVLNTNSSHFDKDRDPVITAVIGHGLLLANGEPWKRQRKIMVRPHFAHAGSFLQLTTT